VREARKSAARVTLTDEDLQAYFTANRAKLTRPPQVRLHEILIRIDPAGGDAAARAAEKKARTVLAQIAKGADFGLVARDASDDAYRVKDGDLGWVHAGRLDADIEQAVFAAPVGSVRQYRSLHGIHLFRVDARQEVTALTFDEARASIESRLTSERRADQERTWHQSLRTAANVEILDPTLRATTPIDLPKATLAPGSV
jgi:parvulin-like peptidyl-prolyl isomerase